MATVQLFERSKVPTKQVGRVASRDLPAKEGAGDTLAAIGDFGGNVFDRIIATRSANEQSEFLGKVSVAQENAQTAIANNPGMPVEELRKLQDQMLIEIDKAGSGLSLPQSRNFAKRFSAKNKGLLKAKFATQVEEIVTGHELQKFNLERKRLVDERRPEELQKLYDGVSGSLLNPDIATASFANDINKIDAMQAKIDAANIEGQAIENAVRTWEATIDDENPTGDLGAALQAIENDKTIPEGDKKEVGSEVKTRITNLQAAATQALEAQQEEDLGRINEQLYINKDYVAADLAIRESSLSNSDKGKLFSDSQRRATAAAKGVPLSNDRVEEARLYEKSLDIWRGTTSKKEFDADLLTNSKKLDDDAYKRVSQSAATTLKSSQAESLSRANTEATRQLVDFANEDVWAKFISDSMSGLAPDAAKLFEKNANEERQLQFWSVSRYNSEMRQWIEDNPDKTGKAFFQQSESLLHTYWNQSIDELKVLQAERVTEVAGQTDEVPTVTTQAAYDALPSGTQYTDSNGVTGVKP